MGKRRVGLEHIPEKFVSTIYKRGNVSIEMTVDTRDGSVCFEGYINGKYVSFSRDSHLNATVRVVNNQLELMDGR